MLKELGPGLRLTLAMTVLTGLLYPGLLTGICQLVLPVQANGSLVSVDGKVVGSSLIAQGFTKAEYFHPRPSAAGAGDDGGLSAGSNLGPTSAKLMIGTTKKDDKDVEAADFVGLAPRVVHYVVENGLAYDSSIPLDKFKDDKGDLDDLKLIKGFSDEKAPLVFTPKTPIPADAVTASSSGLDPHISKANAEAQVSRVAQARGVPPDEVRSVVESNTESADLGILGEPRVNVLMLNIALDARFAKK